MTLRGSLISDSSLKPCLNALERLNTLVCCRCWISTEDEGELTSTHPECCIGFAESGLANLPEASCSCQSTKRLERF
jgi:hypothetical protein